MVRIDFVQHVLAGLEDEKLLLAYQLTNGVYSKLDILIDCPHIEAVTLHAFNAVGFCRVWIRVCKRNLLAKDAKPVV